MIPHHQLVDKRRVSRCFPRAGGSPFSAPQTGAADVKVALIMVCDKGEPQEFVCSLWNWLPILTNIVVALWKSGDGIPDRPI